MTQLTTWLPASAELPLEPSEVHLWRADLDQPSSVLAQLSESLSETETARARRFVFAKDSDRYSVAQGILRQILGRYLQLPARDIQFTIGLRGKPALRDDPSLCFNMAHSNNLVIYAISRNRQLGVDVENQRREFAKQDIVQHYFSEAERSEFLSLPADLQLPAFYLAWTRKEAYIKARGEGLYADLKSFDVSLTPEKVFTLRSEDAARWGLYSFCPQPDFVAALVVEGKDFSVRHWEWTPEFPARP
jgi:4'-phosphopantetheinyl transferase